MGRRHKLRKFNEIIGYPNVLETVEPQSGKLRVGMDDYVELKGKWNRDHFKNEQPIVLELACGKGDYTLGLAERFPEKNFIGVDIKGNRIWRGAKTALDRELSNVAFVRTRIENITHFFEKDEVSEIWITFPDPFLKDSKANRRLTSPNFLKRYRQILASNGYVHLKTDSDELYQYSHEVFAEDDQVEILQDISSIYESDELTDVLSIKTYYEKKHLSLGLTIKYIRFRI